MWLSRTFRLTNTPAGTPTWVDLYTPDLDVARNFYRAVFGWDYDIGAPEYGGYTNARVGQRTAAGGFMHCSFQLPNSYVGMFRFSRKRFSGS